MSLSDLVQNRFSNRGLPVCDCLDQLVELLGTDSLVALTAPPGSGKTVWAPLALWEQVGYRTVYVLEPRRVTARLPALALSEIVGELVGYRIRLESSWHQEKTRVGYLTYGTALRLFLSQPPESDELVIFDEFHERPWEAELLLAYLRSRERTKILVMSATLDLEALPPQTRVVRSDGRLHPVSLSWEPVDPHFSVRPGSLERLICERSHELSQAGAGEQLIFLPGLKEMRSVAQALSADSLPGPVDLLHSSLPEQEIRRVVERPVGAGFRRILSTDLAESSVTLPGVTTVIDGGLVRRPMRDQLDLGPTLRTEQAPLASLTQRAGRAGRLGPGRCHRLFSRQQELHRRAFPEPQLEQADYRTVALFLAESGLLEDWESLPWLYRPQPDLLNAATSWAHQQRLLNNHHPTADGRWVLSVPVSPRLALFALRAAQAQRPHSEIVAVCSLLENGAQGQLSLCLEHWLRSAKSRSTDPKMVKLLTRKLEEVDPVKARSLVSVLLETYQDTVCQFSKDRAVCAAPGQPALLFVPEHPPTSRFGVVLGTRPQGGQGPRSAVTVYQEVTDEELWDTLIEQLQETSSLEWDPKLHRVCQVVETSLGEIALERMVTPALPGPAVAAMLSAHLEDRELGPDFLSLSRRLQLLLEAQADLTADILEPVGVEADSAGIRRRLLLHFLETRNQWTKNCPDELYQHTLGLLGYSTVKLLDDQLPTQVHLPGRRRTAEIEYPDDGPPRIQSKLQDFFGWTQPALLGGALELTCHLLAPNGRACQITTNLADFWKGSYQQVRKDLRGRYPKHPWPEDPTQYRHPPSK